MALAATLYNPVFAVVTRRYPLDFRRAIITLTFLGGLASTVFIPLSAWLIQLARLAPRAVGAGRAAPAGVRADPCRAAARRAAARAAAVRGVAAGVASRSTCAARHSC